MVTSTVCINLAQQPTILKFLHFFQVFSIRGLFFSLMEPYWCNTATMFITVWRIFPRNHEHKCATTFIFFNSELKTEILFKLIWILLSALLIVNLPRGMSRDLVLFMRTLTNLTSDDIWFTFFIRRKQSREKLPKLHFLEQNIWKTPWRQP